MPTAGVHHTCIKPDFFISITTPTKQNTSSPPSLNVLPNFTGSLLLPNPFHSPYHRRLNLPTPNTSTRAPNHLVAHESLTQKPFIDRFPPSNDRPNSQRSPGYAAIHLTSLEAHQSTPSLRNHHCSPAQIKIDP